MVGLGAIGLCIALVRVGQAGLRRRRGVPPLPNRDEELRWMRLGFAVLFGVATATYIANGPVWLGMLNLGACVASLVMSARGFREARAIKAPGTSDL